jgi:pyrroloquinoline-quinone synthase
VAIQTVIAQMQDASSSRNLLEHSFYKRWLAGELTAVELADYAAQYYHVVKMIPALLETAARQHPAHRQALVAHAAEESTHVRLWERFAEACGVPAETLRSIAPNRAARTLLDTCEKFAHEGNAAAVAWALEVQTPAVSKEKIRGLERYYGIDARSGGEYFALHEHLDIEHAAELEQVMAGRCSSTADDARAAVFAASDGMWNLLTSVERAA